MALIEGVGDEVTLLFSCLLLLTVLLLAWISTRTPDPPDHLFGSTTGLAPSQRTSHAHQDTHPSTSPTPPSSSPSSSAGDSAASETIAASTQEKQGGGDDGEDVVRSRTGESSSQRNMVVRLKFLNDTERMAQVQPEDTIGYIKR